MSVINSNYIIYAASFCELVSTRDVVGLDVKYLQPSSILSE